METPTFTDYVSLIINLFDRFVQEHADAAWCSDRYTYEHKTLVAFFMLMQFRRIFQFKTQWRWLVAHPAERAHLGFEVVPHRTTLSRRYKALYQVLQAFTALPAA